MLYVNKMQQKGGDEKNIYNRVLQMSVNSIRTSINKMDNSAAGITRVNSSTAESTHFVMKRCGRHSKQFKQSSEILSYFYL